MLCPSVHPCRVAIERSHWTAQFIICFIKTQRKRSRQGKTKRIWTVPPTSGVPHKLMPGRVLSLQEMFYQRTELWDRTCWWTELSLVNSMTDGKWGEIQGFLKHREFNHINFYEKRKEKMKTIEMQNLARNL